jgi:AcrR family transcriptional regulator
MPSNTYHTILQVAARLFSRQGYTATSIRQIAEESGIGKATVYHHFADKQAIVLALLLRNTARMQEILETVRAETDPRRRIETAARASLQFLYESLDIIQIARREVTSGRAHVQAEFASFLQEETALLTEAIQQGIEQGIFRPIDPARGAWVLRTMLQGTFTLTYLGGEHPPSLEKAAASLLDIFFRGVEKR